MKNKDYPPQAKIFLDSLEDRFDMNKQTHCDYCNCKTKLFANQIQVFTMPDLEMKIFCFEHLLATLFVYDKVKFEELVDANYKFPLRGATKLYFEQKYSQSKLKEPKASFNY